MCTNNIFTQCDVCGRDIRNGNAVLEISRNVEQHDYEEENCLHRVTVIDEVAVPEGVELIDVPSGCVYGGFQHQPADHPTPVAETTDEERERQRYEKKAELLRRALKEADEMEKEQEL
jgi:hypothetical protein